MFCQEKKQLREITNNLAVMIFVCYYFILDNRIKSIKTRNTSLSNYTYTADFILVVYSKQFMFFSICRKKQTRFYTILAETLK